MKDEEIRDLSSLNFNEFKHKVRFELDFDVVCKLLSAFLQQNVVDYTFCDIGFDNAAEDDEAVAFACRLEEFANKPVKSSYAERTEQVLEKGRWFNRESRKESTDIIAQIMSYTEAEDRQIRLINCFRTVCYEDLLNFVVSFAVLKQIKKGDEK